MPEIDPGGVLGGDLEDVSKLGGAFDGSELGWLDSEQQPCCGTWGIPGVRRSEGVARCAWMICRPR